MLESTSPEVEAFLDLQGGTQNIASVWVLDVHAPGDVLVADATSALLGNTDGWELFGVLVPALPGVALVLLLAALAGAGRAALRRSRALEPR